MTTQTHRELSEAVQLVSDMAKRYSDGRPFLDQWQKWARVVLCGVYYSKTAQRAAQSALLETYGCCGRTKPLVGVAKAAALAATGVVHAAQNDDNAAQADANAARNMIEGIELRCGRGKRSRRSDPRRADARHDALSA